jgi:hypothetical protein
MKKCILFFAVCLLVLGLACVAAAADKPAEKTEQAGVDVDLTGYYRVRFENLFKTGWRFNEDFRDGAENQDSDWWSWIDQRGLLLPTIRVNEKIAIKAQVDLLRNVMYGQNAQATVPFVDVERNPSDTEQIENITFDATKLDRGNVFAQGVSANQSYYASEGDARAEISPITLSRLWAEVTLPVGFLRFGRMPSDYGMGIFANSGLPKMTDFGWEGLDKNYGDTYDRIMFGTRFGPYIPILIYDRIMEGDFKTGDKDVHQYIFHQYLRDLKLGANGMFNAGFYVMHRAQHSTNARVFLYDLWLKLNLGGFLLENEALALQGSMTQIGKDTIRDLEENGLPTGEGGGKVQINAYCDAFRTGYKTKMWGALGEFGFSSPSDPNPEQEFDPAAAANVAVAAIKKDADPDSSKAKVDFINTVTENQAAFGRRVYTFAFDKDFQVDQIIWKVLMGGAVRNGAYAKLSGYIQPVNEFRIQADVIKSFVNEPYKGRDGNDASHDLGWEADLDFQGTIYNNFFTGIQFSHAWVGQYFKDVYEDADNVFVMRMRAGVTF